MFEINEKVLGGQGLTSCTDSQIIPHDDATCKDSTNKGTRSTELDGNTFDIITCGKEMSKNNWHLWERENISWSDFVERCTTHKIIDCTMGEYQQLKRLNSFNRAEATPEEIEANAIEVEKLVNAVPALKNPKDYGAFIPCTSTDRIDKHGRVHVGVPSKLKDDIVTLTMLKFDIDSGGIELYGIVDSIKDKGVVYSTMGHTQDNPRLRMMLPLSRPCSINEWLYISMKYEEQLNIKLDGASHRIQQIMYYPCCPKDVTPFTKAIDGDCINVDSYLVEGWEIELELMQVESKQGTRKNNSFNGDNAKKEPRKLPGFMGAFCRAYGVHGAIITFLEGVYTPGDSSTRYTLINSPSGSINGLEVMSAYDGDSFARSWNSSNDWEEAAKNSFELVAYHNFDNDIGKCIKWCAGLKDVQEELIKDEGVFDTNENLIPGMQRIIENTIFNGVKGGITVDDIRQDKDWLQILIRRSGKLSYINVTRDEECLYTFYINDIEPGKGIKSNNTGLLKKFKALADELLKLEMFNAIVQVCTPQFETELVQQAMRERLKYFIEDTVTKVATSGGKTFASALKLLYNVFITKRKTIIGTKQETNIYDFCSEVLKIVDEVILKKVVTTGLVEQWQEMADEKERIRVLGILTLTRNLYGQALENPEEYNAVITNHQHFYGNGDQLGFNKNMTVVLDSFTTGGCDIILDEYQSFKTNGLSTKSINGWVGKKVNIDNGDSIPQVVKAAFDTGDKDSADLFDHPTMFTTQDYYKHDGVYEYRLDINGAYDLKADLEQLIDSKTLKGVDYGNRVPQRLDKDYDLYFVTGVTLEDIVMKESSILNINNDPFGQEFTNFQKLLICQMDKLAVRKQIVYVGTKIPDTEGNEVDNYDFRALETQEKFFQYGHELILKYGEEKGADIFKQLKTRVQHGGDELYIEKVIYKEKNILSQYEGKFKMYMVTANDVQDCKYQVNKDFENESAMYIETVEFIVIPKTKKASAYIGDLIENLRDSKRPPYQVLAFMSRKEEVEKFSKKTKIDHVCCRIEGVGSKEGIRKEDLPEEAAFVNNAYVNGADTEGRNFRKCDMLIMPGAFPINVDGRVDWDDSESQSIRINEIKKAVRAKNIQVVGRVLRGDSYKKYVAIIYFGDVSDAEALIDNYKEFKFETILTVYDRRLNTGGDMSECIEKVYSYADAKIRNTNYGENVEVIDINVDDRAGGNNSKYDWGKIRACYQEAKAECKKVKTIYEILKTKFGVSGEAVKREKRKWK